MVNLVKIMHKIMNFIIIITLVTFLGSNLKAVEEIESCTKKAIKLPTLADPQPGEARKFWINLVTPSKISSKEGIPKITSCGPTSFLEEQKCQSIHNQEIFNDNGDATVVTLAESKKSKTIAEYYKTVDLVDDDFAIYQERITVSKCGFELCVHSSPEPYAFEAFSEDEFPRIVEKRNGQLYALVAETMKWEIYETCDGKLAWSQILDEEFAEDELEEIYEAIDLAIRNSGIGLKHCLKQVDRELIFWPAL